MPRPRQGAWIGGFIYQPTLAVFFLALGVGAIFISGSRSISRRAR